MKFELHEVRSERHPLIGAPNDRRIRAAHFDEAARVFLVVKCGTTRANRAVVAYHKNEMVGFFRFRIDAKRGALKAWGTWVRDDMRRRGLAKALWMHALQIHRPKEVVVYTISRAGRAFIRSIKAMDGLGLIRWYT